MRAAAVITVCVFLWGAANAQLYRTHFYGEDAFARPVPLTKALLTALKTERDFVSCYDRAKDSTEVTKVDPNRDGKTEYLVKVACGNSATSYAFWIVSHDRKRYKPIFSVWTMGIDFEKRKGQGFPNITAAGCNASTCYYESFAFNGKRYARRRLWTRPN